MGIRSALQRSVSQGILNHVPARLLNRVLLAYPALYRTPMINYESRLDLPGLADLRSCVRECKDVVGDIIECGSDRCGTAILMAQWLAEEDVSKTVYACDSFAGFHPAELEAERAAGTATIDAPTFTDSGYAYVSRKIEALGLWKRVRLVRGYFDQTLPSLAGPFSLAFIDCDLGRSIRYCARNLIGRMSPGGYMVFDDYLCPEYLGARRAIEDVTRDLGPQVIALGLRRRLFVLQIPPAAVDEVARLAASKPSAKASSMLE